MMFKSGKAIVKHSIYVSVQALGPKDCFKDIRKASAHAPAGETQRTKGRVSERQPGLR